VKYPRMCQKTRIKGAGERYRHREYRADEDPGQRNGRRTATRGGPYSAQPGATSQLIMLTWCIFEYLLLQTSRTLSGPSMPERSDGQLAGVPCVVGLIPGQPVVTVTNRTQRGRNGVHFRHAAVTRKCK